jgi:phage/conjugal plasmid C-4 type zinc finger TraR family protein
MAGGFAKDGAVQDQIDATVEDAVKRVRDQLPKGKSLKNCVECDKAIPDARRDAVPGVRLCIDCQATLDAKEKVVSGYNRRGSKDSQLR